MDANELLALKRPLTDEEMAVVEQELLSLAQQLGTEISKITRNLDPNDPLIAKLRAAPAKITHNIEQAIECRAEEAEIKAYCEKLRPRKGDVVYSWEKLPVYAWTNELARVIGRLLASLPGRFHIYVHNLGGQAMLLSNCVALGHREVPPGETVSKEELRAYRFIGCHTTSQAMDTLRELSAKTRKSKNDVAHGMSLVGKIRAHFEEAVAELDGAVPDAPTIFH
ncbi:MAG: hypothetical protein ACT443_12315 [Gemmatimonadota bacterium]